MKKCEVRIRIDITASGVKNYYPEVKHEDVWVVLKSSSVDCFPSLTSAKEMLREYLKSFVVDTYYINSKDIDL